MHRYKKKNGKVTKKSPEAEGKNATDTTAKAKKTGSYVSRCEGRTTLSQNAQPIEQVKLLEVEHSK